MKGKWTCFLKSVASFSVSQLVLERLFKKWVIQVWKVWKDCSWATKYDHEAHEARDIKVLSFFKIEARKPQSTCSKSASMWTENCCLSEQLSSFLWGSEYSSWMIVFLFCVTGFICGKKEKIPTVQKEGKKYVINVVPFRHNSRKASNAGIFFFIKTKHVLSSVKFRAYK